jgi:hypothetical protein
MSEDIDDENKIFGDEIETVEVDSITSVQDWLSKNCG